MSSGSTHQAGIIAGSTIGAIGGALLLALGAFIYHRKSHNLPILPHRNQDSSPTIIHPFTVLMSESGATTGSPLAYAPSFFGRDPVKSHNNLPSSPFLGSERSAPSTWSWSPSHMAPPSTADELDAVTYEIRTVSDPEQLSTSALLHILHSRLTQSEQGSVGRGGSGAGRFSQFGSDLGGIGSPPSYVSQPLMPNRPPM